VTSVTGRVTAQGVTGRDMLKQAGRRPGARIAGLMLGRLHQSGNAGARIHNRLNARPCSPPMSSPIRPTDSQIESIYRAAGPSKPVRGVPQTDAPAEV
jgi:hypothetical protein